MNQAHLITVREFEDGCPVPAETLGRLYRADASALPGLVANFSERTRASLAIFLYGRVHTRELGLRVAATCEAALLMQTAGTLGEVIYAQSRDGCERLTYGEDRRPLRRAITLAGPRRANYQHAWRMSGIGETYLHFGNNQGARPCDHADKDPACHGWG